MPANDPAAPAFAPQIAPKWIAKDGKSFWLVWSDFQITDEATSRRLAEEWKQMASPTPDDEVRVMSQWRRIRPYYAFNTQRVDLVLE